MTTPGIGTIRVWSVVHTWTSLIATLFLLILAITGLPLIFHEEIDHYLAPPAAMADVASGAVAPTLDDIVRDALAKQPGDVPISLGFFQDRPAVIVQSGPTPRTPFNQSHRVTIDLRTGKAIDLRPEARGAFTTFLRTLHVELFLGLPGSLFLGVIALMFLAAIISGVIIYAPFMRRLSFGTVRAERSPRLKWLDLHNLLGIITLVWLLAVGTTGAINTLHDPVAAKVRTEIMQMARGHTGGPPTQRSSVDAAIATARKALPDGKLISFFFPGAGFSTPAHYAVFAKGDRPITSQLFYAALIDAQTGALSEVFEMPWYAKILLLSQPLHFGDYGGLPLKIIWALFDIIAILVLGSGVYLWLAKRRTGGVRRASVATSASPAE